MIASLGFRAKTARAIAIALTSDKAAPVYLGRWNIVLHDPADPATSQPHHIVMELPWEDAKSAVQPLERRIENVATEALAKLAGELGSKGFAISGIGIVGSPDRNLDRIGNPHIRAHAAEGILFRRVLETAANNHSLKWQSFSDRLFDEFAAAELRHQPLDIKAVLASIKGAAGKPWRADERAAATAAWLSLPPFACDSSDATATLQSRQSSRRRTRR
jgi:hypothetical protein